MFCFPSPVRCRIASIQDPFARETLRLSLLPPAPLLTLNLTLSKLFRGETAMIIIIMILLIMTSVDTHIHLLNCRADFFLLFTDLLFAIILESTFSHYSNYHARGGCYLLDHFAGGLKRHGPCSKELTV